MLKAKKPAAPKKVMKPAAPQKGSSPPPPGCVCFRPKGTVFCRMCGWVGHGRVGSLCIAHPRTFYLMDLTMCPKCKAMASFLQEMIC